MRTEIENKKLINEKGYIAFISMLIISAVALGIAGSISLLGIGEARNSLDFKKGQETLKIAESCVEETLLRLREDDTYTGGSLTVGDGNCTTSVSGTGNDRTVDVISTINDPVQYTKRIRVSVKVASGSTNIINWQEVE